jgi:hypothetical protein
VAIETGGELADEIRVAIAVNIPHIDSVSSVERKGKRFKEKN